MASSSSPSELIPVEQAARDGLYQADPVGWAEDFLDVHLWSKQREVLVSRRAHQANG